MWCNMSDIALSVRKIGKEYRIGERHEYRTIREKISNFALETYRRMTATVKKKSPKNNNDHNDVSIDDANDFKKTLSANPGFGYRSVHETKKNFIWSLK